MDDENILKHCKDIEIYLKYKNSKDIGSMFL